MPPSICLTAEAPVIPDGAHDGVHATFGQMPASVPSAVKEHLAASIPVN